MLDIASVNFLFAGQSPFLEICRKEKPMIYEYHQNYFLIDAYKMYRDDTIYYYKYEGPDGTEMPGYLERRYGSPYYAMYGMRWCTYNCSDDAWYAIDSSLGLNYSYIRDSEIIYDFTNTD